jgi:hypothetical protein
MLTVAEEAQRLWPDDLIDMATGDTLVGLHHATIGVAGI